MLKTMTKPKKSKKIQQCETQKSEESSTRSSREKIARKAYEFYEKRGCICGHEQEDWFEAEKQLKGKK